MSHPYLQVADDIVLRIRRGEWKSGERIPAVRALEALYPHSRATLHKALQHLEASGYVNMVHGRGTFVKASHVKDRIGILSGGIVGEHEQSPFSTACINYARAGFTRLGLSPFVYSEDPLAVSRMPAALVEDLDSGKLKGLLTVQSSFSFKHLGTDAWRRQRVPHVDIGSQPAPHRVYIDFGSFMRKALALAASEGRRRPLLIAAGSGLTPDELRRRFGGSGASVYQPPPDVAAVTGIEEFGFRLMLGLIRDRADFDALIVSDDAMAKGIAQGALAGGVEVPRQVRILALCNRGIELFYPVPVTRLEVDVEALVIQAAEQLLQLIRDPALPPETRLIPPDRETAGGEWPVFARGEAIP